MIYQKYSNYQVGNHVQGDEVTGEHLTITLKVSEPYSSEGIPMTDRPLIKDGVLKTIHGNSRFSYYLGTEPTGTYDSFRVTCGTETFSDFQMDTFSGHFAGEIRLAFLSDGNTVIPVTGGSINGNLLEAQKNLIFSKEMQLEKGYEGPYAVKFEKVSVAGA
jgi:predicted Zn-dependent protease